MTLPKSSEIINLSILNNNININSIQDNLEFTIYSLDVSIIKKSMLKFGDNFIELEKNNTYILNCEGNSYKFYL